LQEPLPRDARPATLPGLHGFVIAVNGRRAIACVTGERVITGEI
jgi:hypothetical protein